MTNDCIYRTCDGMCANLLRTYGMPCPDEIVACRVPPITVSETGTSPNQEAKADAGKLDLTLVPRQIIRDIAEIRMYGNKKYHSPDNWKTVSKERYRAATFRHFLAYLDDPDGVDSESGLSHLSHLACNIAFLCEMEHNWKD